MISFTRLRSQFTPILQCSVAISTDSEGSLARCRRHHWPHSTLIREEPLFLEAAQGKVSTLAHDIIRDRAKELNAAWPNDSSFDLARGVAELGLWLMDNGDLPEPILFCVCFRNPMDWVVNNSTLNVLRIQREPLTEGTAGNGRWRRLIGGWARR